MASSPTRVTSGDTHVGRVPGSQKEALVFLGQTSGGVLCHFSSTYLSAKSLVTVNLCGFTAPP